MTARRGPLRAILGGTFDPVHRGHLHAAGAARRILRIDEATLLLAARPWHRPPPQAGIAQRWQMLRLAARATPGLAASDAEIGRDGPSYTVEMLELLAGDRPLVWLIGRDALDGIACWHRIADLPQLCHLLVFDRPGAQREAGAQREDGAASPPPPGFERVADPRDFAAAAGGGIHFADAGMLPISATAVRAAIARNARAGALLSPPVWAYIRRHGLYGYAR